MCVPLGEAAVFTLALFVVLALPAPQGDASLEENRVVPEQVLAWQLQGLTQEEIRDEVSHRGLTECPDQALLNALAAAGSDAETIGVVRSAKAPCTVWKLGLRLPRSTDYLYELAAAVMWKDWGHALGTIQRETTRHPRNADAHSIYAHLLGLSRDWIMAYGEATEAARLAPESPYEHEQRSAICYHSRLTECAVHEALLFVKARPGDAFAHITLGHARELQRHDDEALDAYAEAKRLNPGYAELYAGLGRICGRQGEFEKAVAALREAIRLDPAEADHYGELAQIYAAEGQWHEAIENWKKAKELEPRWEILLALGNAYLANEQYGAAVREYQELLQAAPETDGAWEQLAKALRAEGREAEARAAEKQNGLSPE